MRKKTQAEIEQLAFISKHITDTVIGPITDKEHLLWNIMSPGTIWCETDMHFAHLIAIDFSPLEAMNNLRHDVGSSQFETNDELKDWYQTKFMNINNDFREMIRRGKFETVEDFIQYYQENILPFVLKGTDKMLMNMREKTRAEVDQLAFISKSSEESIEKNEYMLWNIMSPRFRWGIPDMQFSHLVAIGFTPKEAHENLIVDSSAHGLKTFENEFKKMMFHGGFETTEAFIEYYQAKILPFVLKGTEQLICVKHHPKYQTSLKR